MKKFAEEKSVLGKVQLRGGFSDRNGINSVSTKIQLDDFDERTRTLLYNRFSQLLEAINWATEPYFEWNHHSWEELYGAALENIYCLDMTAIDYRSETFDRYVESTIKNDTYDAVLTVIEYIFSWTRKFFKHRRKWIDYDHYTKVENGIQYDQIEINEFESINAFFEQECVGYRFVGDRIVKITDSVEIEEIESAIMCSFEGCRTHINNALNFLADRDTKDYKNCIKESISAVESVCSIITGKPKATLGDALKLLESKRGLKGQLKSAFEKLYNYTNDKGGIRHAEGLFVSEVTFEEAKFMLVCCSAFVNYLIAEYGKIDGDE